MFDRKNDKVDPISGARPLGVSEARVALENVLGHCGTGVVAFDLDSTLLDNRPRNARIMREFAQTLDNALLMGAQAEHWQSWSALQAMCNMGLSRSEAEALSDRYESFWAERFFTSEYCRDDDTVPGAAQYAQAVADQGGHLVYLTGRPETMRAGTIHALNHLAFPGTSIEGVQLWMKPQADDSDDEFKQQAFNQLTGLGELVAAFDNEPTHINAYRQTFPQAACFHLFTDHSMRRVKLLENIMSIRHFAT